MLSRYSSKLMVCGKRRHTNSSKDKVGWIPPRDGEWTRPANHYPVFSKFWKVWIIINKNIFRKLQTEFLNIQKPEIYGKNTVYCSLYCILHKISSWYHKKSDGCCPESKKAPFHTISWDSSFRFSLFADLGLSKNVTGPFFSHSWRKTSPQYVSHNPSPKLSAWPFKPRELWWHRPEMCSPKARMVLILVPQTRWMLIDFFIWYGYTAR